MSTEQVDQARCVACGREYAGTSSRPRWAFDREGRLVGTIHAGCALPHGRHREFFAESPVEEPVEIAGFWAWYRLYRPDVDAPDGRTWLPVSLALEGPGDPNAGLNEAQVGLLAHWRTGGLGLTDEECGAIMEEYRRLVGEYRAWRRAPEGDDGCD